MKGISIIVPIYNVKIEYLEYCIQSLINQTYKELEILLIDDGSTNNDIEKTCNKYGLMDERIKYIKLENNLGTSNARNVGIDNASCEWLMFVDSDDWIEKDTCEKLSQRFNIGMDIIIFNPKLILEKKEYKNVFLNSKSDSIIEDLNEIRIQIINKVSAKHVPKYNCIGVVCGKLYKKDIIIKNKIRFDVGITRAEDHLFLLKVLNLNPKILYLDEYMYNYRKNPNSAVNKYSPNVKYTFKKTLDELYKVNDIQNNKWLEKYFKRRVIRYITLCFKNDYFHKNNHMNFKTFKNEIKELKSIEPYKTVLSEFYDLKSDYKERIRIFLIRHNLYLLLYIYCKIINQNY